MSSSLFRRLFAPKDIAHLAVFRILFGAMMVFGLSRFVLQGWVDEVFVKPTFFFKYDGLGWTVVWPQWGLYLHFAVVGLAALCVSLGLFYRVAIVVFWVGFAYLQALDVTLYLNHYYFVILVSGLMCFMPLEGAWSLDAKRKPALKRDWVPAWMTYLLRFQIGVVYFFAALAKAQPDWLLHAQPLNIWLQARTETPVIGFMLGEVWVAHVMSWAGFLYDLTIWIWLLIPRTRPFAYVIVLVFHFFTHVFFEIGMFPIIMVVATLNFFEADWPRRFGRFIRRRWKVSSEAAFTKSAPAWTTNPTGQRKLGVALATGFIAMQILFPLRHYWYPSDVLWSEQGMRYAWKVMVREKNGSITYHVKHKASGKVWQVNPLDYLTWRQFSDMSGQPDLIVQLGKHIAWDFQQRGFGEVEVRAEAWVSLNGRPPALLIDPKVDINRVDNSWRVQDWILPKPNTSPVTLTRLGP